MGCAAVGALCLRTPDNSAGFVASGVVPLFMDVLKIHKLKVAVEVIHHTLSYLAYSSLLNLLDLSLIKVK